MVMPLGMTATVEYLNLQEWGDKMSETNIFGSFFDNYYKAAKNEVDFAAKFIDADKTRRVLNVQEEQQFNFNDQNTRANALYYDTTAPNNALNLGYRNRMHDGSNAVIDAFNNKALYAATPEYMQFMRDSASAKAALDVGKNNASLAYFNGLTPEQKNATMGAAFATNEFTTENAQNQTADMQRKRAEHTKGLADGSITDPNYQRWANDDGIRNADKVRKSLESPLAEVTRERQALKDYEAAGGVVDPRVSASLNARFLETYKTAYGVPPQNTAAVVAPAAAVAPAVNPVAKQLAAPLTSQDVQDIDKWMKPEYLAMSKSVKDAETELRIAMGNGTVEQQRQALTKVQVRKENFNGMLSTVPTNAANSIRTRLGF